MPLRQEIPVSYTHLDVYKRQGHNDLTNGKETEDKSVTTVENMVIYRPVSYTHLDVYKRQIENIKITNSHRFVPLHHVISYFISLPLQTIYFILYTVRGRTM